MGGSSNAVSYYVYGNNIDDIGPIVLDIENVLKDHADLKDVKTSLARTYKEYTLATIGALIPLKSALKVVKDTFKAFSTSHFIRN